MKKESFRTRVHPFVTMVALLAGCGGGGGGGDSGAAAPEPAPPMAWSTARDFMAASEVMTGDLAPERAGGHLRVAGTAESKQDGTYSYARLDRIDADGQEHLVALRLPSDRPYNPAGMRIAAIAGERYAVAATCNDGSLLWVVDAEGKVSAPTKLSVNVGSLEATRDGGVVLAGESPSSPGSTQIVQFRADGQVLGTWHLFAEAPLLLPQDDGTYVLCSSSKQDLFVGKLDEKFQLVVGMARRINVRGYDWAYSIASSPGGGCLITGFTIDGGVRSAFVLELRADLRDDWLGVYTFGTFAEGWSCRATPDGGCILAGTTYRDAILAKLAADGSFVWKRSYRTLAAVASGFTQVRLAPDGGHVALGFTGATIDNNDSWVLKCLSDGTMPGVTQVVVGSLEGTAVVTKAMP